jgi:Macrocin-O-methyltransferase (TylF)
VFGFDHFQGLQDFDAKDGALNDYAAKTPGGYGLLDEREAILRLVALHNQDNLLPGVERCRLIEGDVVETLPRFLTDNPGLRVSMLHLDVDLYRPTKFALEQLYARVVTGGVIVLDEYGLMPWEGESQAVEEFCREHGLAPAIRKFPFSVQPHGYWVKT